VAQLLIDHGRANVHYLQGGFEAWRRAGFELESK
jgi:rhodanese-related sulfurtransferase